MMKTIRLFVFLAAFGIIFSSLLIKYPQQLVESITKINKKDEGEIQHRLANFGEIPYGKTLNGFLYVHDIVDRENNDWCDEKVFNHVDETFEDLPAIVLANDKNCPFTQKALNVQNARGSALIIYTNTEHYDYLLNVDDLQYGANLTIPSVIIKNKSGLSLLATAVRNETTEDKKNERIIVSLSFKKIVDNNEVINMDYYLRSDQVNALHFFKEFERYKNLLSKNLVFTPHYKYSYCFECKSSTDLKAIDETGEGCIGEFCGAFNPELKIENSKLVALENLRQKCIFTTHSLDDYWTYMIKFSDVCADYSIPYFSEDCSKKMMQEIDGIDQSKVDKCMTNEITILTTITKQDSIIMSDYESYKNNRIYRFPQIEINGTKYKGSWFGKHVFNSICSNSNNPACLKEISTDYEYGVTKYEIPAWLIILIIVAVVSILILVVLCYRRYVNKLIETSIESRIFSQTNNSIGNYTKMDKDTISIK